MTDVFTVLARDHEEVKAVRESHADGNSLADEATVQGMRSVLSAEAAALLGRKIADAKKTAPTRPHPHTPPSPGVLKAAGPAAAAADKARDAVTGRGA